MESISVDLLPRTGTFYKANLHSHCTCSDGKWTKEKLKAEYIKKGYSVVAFTDHNYYKWHEELCDESFLAIASLEINIEEELVNSKLPHDKRTFHINLYDTIPQDHKSLILPKVPVDDYFNKDSLNAYIARFNELGFLACYNHPWWSLQHYDDYVDFKGLFAMEIYNHGCEVKCSNGYAPQAYDEMLSSGQKIFCIASDDNHNDHGSERPLTDSFGGWVCIKADSLSYKSIMDAMKSGNFYASTGPEIHELYIMDNVVHVTCSSVNKIVMHNDGRYPQFVFAKNEEGLTHAEFSLKGTEKYIRIDCEDIYKSHAYSNAYFL